MKLVVGSGGSFGQPCTNDMQCWQTSGGSAYCYSGVCVPYDGEGSSTAGCWDRPITQQCHGSTFGCCPTDFYTCTNTVGGYICL
ncbi:hypothetical protein EOD40_11110 [Flavobacterium sufflavum]|uniref:Uncharacterized protein n=1 Tax=Flavobacterium sufflavum TaxID=1921138 RepID=A0A437KT55_9FLAO|nr:hypothetical protein [Flavobacterium sufflavum]RVT75309.1 hypothetical protein EOD40_11110 [Flavobacterium sufflavum]